VLTAVDAPPPEELPNGPESDEYTAREGPVQAAALLPGTGRPPDLGGLAAAILAGRPEDALSLWRDTAARLGAGIAPDQEAQIESQLETLSSIDETILASLEADIGKPLQLQLAHETISCEIADVLTDGVQVKQRVKHGRGTGTLGRRVRIAELSVAEKVRRLGNGDGAQQSLQRAMLAITVGRLDTAAKLFGKAEGPLAQALVAEIENEQAMAKAAAAQRACDELMRQICATGTPRNRDEALAGIRERCQGHPKKVQEARKLLTEFEQRWGTISAAQDVVLTVREALNSCFPWPQEPWTVPTIAADLVPVPAGRFQMGSDAGRPNSRPVHTVRISRNFWLGRTEVTQRQYEALIHRNPAAFRGENRPVEQVNWGDAMAFCRLLSERENAAGRVPDGYEYRLPTEAEWEYAAQGVLEPTATIYAGSDRVEEVAWFAQTSGETTHDVALLKPNRLGLYDMSGNVWEWCLDWCQNDYYARSPDTDPVCTKPSVARSMRGGAWNSVVWGTETSGRDGQGPMLARNTVGFRICLGPHMDLP
jgi:formylglycine-generating enzyme required for sulfatase activity